MASQPINKAHISSEAWALLYVDEKAQRLPQEGGNLLYVLHGGGEEGLLAHVGDAQHAGVAEGVELFGVSKGAFDGLFAPAVEGMDVLVLAKILGHAQPSTTLNMYGHVLPDHKKESMEKLRALYEIETPALAPQEQKEIDEQIHGMKAASKPAKPKKKRSQPER